MGNLAFINEQPGTVDLINKHYEQKNKPRGYLGLSQAGHECRRYLWYMHSGEIGSQPDGRVMRLFQLGNLLEDQVIADLRSCGIIVHGQQREVEFTQGPVRLVGHIDGIVHGLVEAPKTPHLFECKSASKKKFDELVKLGSYEKWNAVYGWQIQFYMVGLNLKRAAVFVYNKDDSRLYMERIKVRKEEAMKRLERVFEAITSPIAPDRLCSRADAYQAKWCPFYEQCFNGTSTANTGMGWEW